MKLVIVQCSVPSCFLFLLDPNILLRAITIIFALTSEPPVIVDLHNKSRHLITCVV